MLKRQQDIRRIWCTDCPEANQGEGDWLHDCHVAMEHAVDHPGHTIIVEYHTVAVYRVGAERVVEMRPPF